MLLRLLSLTAAAALSPLATAAFTARDMLSAPRPHAPVLHPSGNSALHIVDQWDASTDHMSRTVSLLELLSGHSKVLVQASPKEVGEVFWIRDEWAYLNGSTVTKGHNGEEVYSFAEGVGASNIKYEGGKLFFVGQVWEGYGMDETDEVDKRYEERGDTGVVYDELFVRHWDTWRTPGKGWTVGYVELAKGKVYDLFDKSQFGHRRFVDAPSYTLHPSHIAINYKPPHLSPALHTFTRLDVFRTNGAYLFEAQTPDHHGARASPVISRDGDKMAFLAMKEDGYESDLNSVHVVRGLKDGTERSREEYLVAGRDMSPSQLTWSLDGESLYFIADVQGRAAVFRYSFGEKPLQRIVVDGSASSIVDTPHGLLVTASSLKHPSRVYLNGKALTDTPSLPIHPEDFWFQGASQKVHGFVINPRIKNAPLAFLIHGGPQSAWTDSWSTRWNPGLMALQGYFIVAINPTGSTGYGQDFTDAIQYNWGGSPYKDLVVGYHAVLSQYAEWIDANRTAALGGSYGGYMINWIQGHNPGFKALVCHDGTFDTTTSRYTTEEVYFIDREFGDPVNNRQVYEKWNPMNHVGNWKTPQLVIHSANDFRLVNSNGVAAFTALQTRGVPSRYLFFPDENHWVLKPSNSMRWHHEVFRWLDEWVGHGGKASEVEEVEEVASLIQLDTSQVVL